MGQDEEILSCISSKFKTARQISEETGIGQSRVSVKLNMLLKFGMVMSLQGQSTDRGVKPLLYKRK